MQRTQAIYIQGCARSGNTLMRELCVAGFRGAELVKVSNEAAECSLAHLAGLLPAGRKWAFLSPLAARLFPAKEESRPLLVASRDAGGSWSMDEKLLRAYSGIKVLWMLRNPLDVLTSIHAQSPDEFYVKPERLLKSLMLYQRFQKNPQILAIHYEELVSDPRTVQARIAQVFQLESARDFSEGYKHFPRFVENVRALHSIRPIDANSVQKWRTNTGYKEYLQRVLAENPALIALARDCGYEINLA